MKSNLKEQEDKKGKKHFKFISEPFGLLLAAFISLSFSMKAGTFVIHEHGNYNDASNWKHGYAGNYIRQGDTVHINAMVTLNTDIVVQGVLITGTRYTLTGSHNIVVLGNGVFINNGVTVIKAINNRGFIINRKILETEVDMINIGNIENYHSIVAGNIFENTGIISGSMGSVMANARLVNIGPGKIAGTTDVCAGGFSNVNGGIIDSANVSFCGSRIFNTAYLTASIATTGIQLKLHNSRHADNKEYLIEKSADGKEYNTIATVRSNEISAVAPAYTIYTDKAALQTASVYYRVKITTRSGAVHHIAPVSIGSMKNSLLTALE
jgi:hypothetical protein